MLRDIQLDIPESHGLSSMSLIEFFSRIEQLNLAVNSFVLLQNGKSTAKISFLKKISKQLKPLSKLK